MKKNEWLCKKQEIKETLKEDEYYESFGIIKVKDDWIIKNQQLVDEAYKKAWENRNFEINKFWSRSAYFGGFISAILIAFTALLTKESNPNFSKEFEDFLKSLLLSMGTIFSLAWVLAIKGSKFWQENWEKHIDYLEDFVSGPIHKIAFYDKSPYSVSKINLVLAKLVCLAWLVLFIWYYKHNFSFALGCQNINWVATIIIIITALFGIVLCFGYPLNEFKVESAGFIKRKK